ncbi:hypothetical protein Enr13x_18350 [Stieleria neptunia]|uniref:Uncharacterized protein n=1 Tax=Stieleria neptunia TaxID=2527979 RepID=A0A518HMA8_9BACT|nr:hypothetical protein [Stieleria neptunia]QDV41992.1 hypothetical protein Enr13x_18350 [Stieleria neptunia]
MNRLGIVVTTALLTLGIDHLASAQSTIQLPSFSRFTYSGSVLVPTGGRASLGGVSRSASGRSSRRGGGRGIGAGVGHAGASAHVTIIDHDAIDRQIRGLPPKGTGTSSLSKRPITPAASKTDPDAEGKALVRFARKQYLAGRRTSAFDAYRLAIETLSPRLSDLAAAEFRRVFPAEKRPVTIQPGRFVADGR